MIIPGIFLLPTQIVPLEISDPDHFQIITQLLSAKRTFGVLWPSTHEGVTAEIISSNSDKSDQQVFEMLMLDPTELIDIYKIKIIGRQRFTLDTKRNDWIERSQALIEKDTLNSVQTSGGLAFSLEKYQVTILPLNTFPSCPIAYGNMNDQQDCDCESDQYMRMLMGSSESYSPSCCNCNTRNSFLPFSGMSFLKPKNLIAQIILMLEKLTRPVDKGNRDFDKSKNRERTLFETSKYYEFCAKLPRYCPDSEISTKCVMRSHDQADISKLDGFTALVYALALKDHSVHHCNPLEPKIPPLRSFISRMALEVARTSNFHMLIFWLIRSLPIFSVTDMYRLVHTHQGLSEKLLFIDRMLKSHLENELKQINLDASAEVNGNPLCMLDRLSRSLFHSHDCLFCARCGTHITNLRFICSVSTRKRRRIKYKSVLRQTSSDKIKCCSSFNRRCFPDYEEPYLFDPATAYFEQISYTENDANMEEPGNEGASSRQQQDNSKAVEQTYEYEKEPDYFEGCDSELVETEEIPGDCSHVFVNAVGVMFETVSFSRAWVNEVGFAADSHYSWFPHYGWWIVNCPKCFVHLGWKYTLLYESDSFENNNDVLSSESGSIPHQEPGSDPVECSTANAELDHNTDIPSHSVPRTFSQIINEQRYSSHPILEVASKVPSITKSRSCDDNEAADNFRHFLYNTLHDWSDALERPKTFFGLNKRSLTFKRPLYPPNQSANSDNFPSSPVEISGLPDWPNVQQ